jgi:hypothetical protein
MGLFSGQPGKPDIASAGELTMTLHARQRNGLSVKIPAGLWSSGASRSNSSASHCSRRRPELSSQPSIRTPFLPRMRVIERALRVTMREEWPTR